MAGHVHPLGLLGVLKVFVYSHVHCVEMNWNSIWFADWARWIIGTFPAKINCFIIMQFDVIYFSFVSSYLSSDEGSKLSVNKMQNVFPAAVFPLQRIVSNLHRTKEANLSCRRFRLYKKPYCHRGSKFSRLHYSHSAETYLAAPLC